MTQNKKMEQLSLCFKWVSKTYKSYFYGKNMNLVSFGTYKPIMHTTLNTILTRQTQTSLTNKNIMIVGRKEAFFDVYKF